MIPFIYIVCIYSESFFGHPCIIFFTIKAQLPLEFSWLPAFVPPSRLHLSQLPWRTSPIKEWLEKANGSLISTRRQETNIWKKLHLYIITTLYDQTDIYMINMRIHQRDTIYMQFGVVFDVIDYACRILHNN